MREKAERHIHREVATTLKTIQKISRTEMNYTRTRFKKFEDFTRRFDKGLAAEEMYVYLNKSNSETMIHDADFSAEQMPFKLKYKDEEFKFIKKVELIRS